MAGIGTWHETYDELCENSITEHNETREGQKVAGVGEEASAVLNEVGRRTEGGQ